MVPDRLNVAVLSADVHQGKLSSATSGVVTQAVIAGNNNE